MSKQQQQYILVVIVLAGALYAYFTYLYMPIAKQISTKITERNSKKQQLQEVKLQATQLAKLEKEAAGFKERLQKARVRIPAKDNLYQLIREIIKAEKETGILLSSIIPQPYIRAAAYTDMPLKLSITGTYHSIGQFINKLNTITRIIAITDIQFAVLPTSSSLDKTISAQLQLGAYFKEDGTLMTPAEAEKLNLQIKPRFIYSSMGKRDPFTPLTSQEMVSLTAGMDIKKLRLTGMVSLPHSGFATLEDENTMTYTLKNKKLYQNIRDPRSVVENTAGVIIGKNKVKLWQMDKNTKKRKEIILKLEEGE